MGVTEVKLGNLRQRWSTWTRMDGESLSFDLGTAQLTGALLSFHVVGLIAMALGEFLPAILRVPIIVVALTFIPGSLAVLLFVREPVVDATRLLYAFGASLIILMLVGMVTNIVLPGFGYPTPLTKVPMAAAVTYTVGVLGGAVLIHRGRERVHVCLPPLAEPTPLGLVSVPLLAIIGVEIVNRTGSNLILVLVLILVAVMPLLMVRVLDKQWYAFGIWTMSLAILYHKSLWQYSGFGGRPHGIIAWKAGRWSPGVQELVPYSSELLPNGLLFPMYAHLADIFIMTQYEVVNPFLVSFIPVAVFVAVRRFVDYDLALMAAALFAFVHPFYLQYPTAGRAASPVIFLALFGVTLSNTDHRPGVNTLFAQLFLLGIVVSHYGTSYFVIFAFFIALIALATLRLADAHLIPRLAHLQIIDAEDGIAAGNGREHAPARFSPSMVAYFSAAAIGWYLYMRQGWKFDLLPSHISENLRLLTEGSVETGRTAARIQRDYGAVSIEFAKYVYLVITVLMGVGALVVFYRRFTGRDSLFEDEYLALGASLLAVFGLTILYRNWGGGRPMMIALVLTAVFAVIGVKWFTDRTGYSATTVFGTLLAIMLVVNTGVVASALGGSAPSNVPLDTQLAVSDNPEDQVTVHRETDIVTHLWVIENRASFEVYADTFGARQFDWYRPDIAARAPGLNEGYGQRHPNAYNASQGPLESGHLLVLGHNEELQGFWPDRFSSGQPIEVLELETRQRVYSNGEASVYFTSRD